MDWQANKFTDMTRLSSIDSYGYPTCKKSMQIKPVFLQLSQMDINSWVYMTFNMYRHVDSTNMTKETKSRRAPHDII